MASVFAALLIAGCGGGSDESSSTTTSTESTSTTTSSTTTSTETTAPNGGTPAPSGTVQLYFTTGEQFEKVDSKLKASDSNLEDAATMLLHGPPAEKSHGVELQSAIPQGTTLDDVSLGGDGTATVSVSARFMDGVSASPAGRDREQRAELAARLGQITYTLAQLPGVQDTKVVAGGEPVVSDDTNAPVVEPKDYAKPSTAGPGWKAKPKGEKSLSTKDVQKRLAALHYLPPGAVDGEAGYRTQQAVMAFQAWEGLGRDGVVGPMTTAALAKAKTPRPSSQGPSKRIEVYRSKGVILEIAHNKVRRAIHVSTGQPGLETPAGTFKVFRKELRSWSVPFQVWLPYASYFNNGIAFHEYPDVPPYPASHGCVRVPSPEAPGVYKFAKLGTTVIVF
jgi:peptidoglycan hydrolase-like protein with peptidoglycan-binding domain